MGRGSRVWLGEECVCVARELQSCWCCRLKRTLDARVWRYFGCASSVVVVLVAIKSSSNEDVGGSSVEVAEGAIVQLRRD